MSKSKQKNIPFCSQNVRIKCIFVVKLYQSMYKREIDNSWDFKTSNTKEFTHCYHTYPAMMIPQVARKLICDYSPEGKLNLLFDPYMGSGTSLVEASITGINSIGTDINPLARLMSKVKSTHFDQKVICDFFSVIQSELPFYSPDKVTNRDFDRISNYSYWYSEDNLLKLSHDGRANLVKTSTK